MKKVFTIGSATMDAFVECDDANIVSVCTNHSSSDFMCYPYGAKVDMSNFTSNIGGGGLNTAVNFDKLGYNTSAILKVGKDIFSAGIFDYLSKTNINIDNVVVDKTKNTGFSIILVSFQGDRTVLANRGANADITVDDICFDKLKDADLLYIAPLNNKSNQVLEPLVEYAHKNNIIVCFNAGTTSIKQGFNYIKKILATSNIVVMNKEEASMCSGIEVRTDTKTEKYSKEIIHPDIKKMLEVMKIADYQVIVITDGGKGAYAFDGKKYYFCPVFPSDVVSTLGAGDAFASTFCAALERTDKNISKSLMFASVVSSSVVSNFGATDGLLSFDEIQKKLNDAENYSCIEV